MRKICVYIAMVLLSCLWAGTLVAQETTDCEKAVRRQVKQERRDADWAKFYRYAHQNDSLLALAGEKPATTVVFYGNSLTDRWYRYHPDFFTSHGYTGRGIGGQTTSEMLVRFRADVLDLRPRILMLMAGTNDLAQNNGIITMQHSLDNIRSMVELSRLHGITPVICSVLPSRLFRWHAELGSPAERIREFNALLQQYCREEGLTYVDYYALLTDTDGGMKPGLSDDETHLLPDAYSVIEPLAVETISRLMGER